MQRLRMQPSLVCAVLAATAGSLLLAPIASAATSSCVTAAGGTLCATVSNGGYRAAFTPGNAGRYDFQLWCADGNWFGDGGEFNASSARTNSYVFAIGNRGECSVRLIHKDQPNGNSTQTWNTGLIRP